MDYEDDEEDPSRSPPGSPGSAVAAVSPSDSAKRGPQLLGVAEGRGGQPPKRLRSGDHGRRGGDVSAAALANMARLFPRERQPRRPGGEAPEGHAFSAGGGGSGQFRPFTLGSPRFRSPAASPAIDRPPSGSALPACLCLASTRRVVGICNPKSWICTRD